MPFRIGRITSALILLSYVASAGAWDQRQRAAAFDSVAACMVSKLTLEAKQITAEWITRGASRNSEAKLPCASRVALKSEEERAACEAIRHRERVRSDGRKIIVIASGECFHALPEEMRRSSGFLLSLREAPELQGAFVHRAMLDAEIASLRDKIKPDSFDLLMAKHAAEEKARRKQEAAQREADRRRFIKD